MCKAIMSIKSEYVEKIFSGDKTFEYRKVAFSRESVDKIIIYETSPVMKVVGEVEVIGVLIGHPNLIWKKTSKSGGISKEKYDQYYESKELAIAYKLGKAKKYLKVKKLSDYGINYYPQSFVYID